MIQFILFACLLIQVALSIKLYLLNPHRKLNIYLSLVPGFSVFITILEINIFFTTDIVYANHLYYVYQSMAFFVNIAATLGYVEYIKIYTPTKSKLILKAINASVIITNCLWTVLVIIFGPTGRIFLSAPGQWSIDRYSIGPLFLAHTYASMFWLVVSVAIFIYLLLNAESKKKKCWFGLLAFLQLLLVIGIFSFITSHHNNLSPQADIMVSIPTTIAVFFQVCVLSSFTIFDINPKTIYSDALAATNNWIYVLDKKGNIRYVNDLATQQTGFNAYQLNNGNIENVLEIKNIDSPFTTPLHYLNSFTDANFSEIIIRFKKTGKLLNLQSSHKKLTLPDKTEVFLWVLIDTSQMETLRKQNAVIEATSAELKRAYDDMVFVIDITSHDLKTPLLTLVELAHLVKKESQMPSPNRIEEYLGYIESISQQSLTFSTKMIEFMQVGARQKNKEWNKISQIIRKVRDRMFITIEKSAAQITYEGIQEVYCDPSQLQELLTNFIDNAIKYRSAEVPQIHIKIFEVETMYHFSIKDNGIGIEEDFIPRLFLKYSREKINQAPGTGIGLFICKNIIETNNGEISISNNKPNKGITILFTLAKADDTITNRINRLKAVHKFR
jgi:signal transduction histidine kinase